MKFIQKLMDERFARSASRLMKFACYFIICFFVLCTVLSLMGRQTFFLHTKTDTFEHAIYAEEDHTGHSRSMTVSMGDDIHVWTNRQDRISPAVAVGLSLMYTLHTVPMILSYCFLSRVFSNVEKGEIFTEQNSAFLLYYGLLRLLGAILVPFAKLLICWLVTLVSDSRMSIATGQGVLNTVISGIAFIVAAYIIHYGVHLQDEVDHTL